MIYIGTAAWNIPKNYRSHFHMTESLLESYASVFNAVEINTTFHKHHQAKTFLKWAECTPAHFRFSLKLAKRFTHQAGLGIDEDLRPEFRQALKDYQGLGKKLGCLLVQLPPKLAWEPDYHGSFFAQLREFFEGPVALEPRHKSWAEPEVEEILKRYRVGRVWADPERIPNPTEAEYVATDFVYFRLHGSPQTYRTSYEPERLAQQVDRIRAARKVAKNIWCIFDNTALNFATENALDLRRLTAELRG